MAGLRCGEISLNLPWSITSISSITSTLSSLYCLFTITVYVVITINKFATNSLKNHAEVEVCLLIKMKEDKFKIEKNIMQLFSVGKQLPVVHAGAFLWVPHLSPSVPHQDSTLSLQ